MGIRLLGPLEVDGATRAFSPRDRVVLQALSLRPGSVVSPEALAVALWGEDGRPASWSKIVQGCVVRLRKELGADRIDTLPHGYRLVVPRDELDHERFEHLVGRARELMARGEAERAAYLLREALSLWRGDPLQDLLDWENGRLEVERLTELRRDAEELLVEARLVTGHPHEVVGEARRLVTEAPLREARWAWLARAQYQAGQQAEALHSVRRARAVLLRELGLDPGPDLMELERAILQQDPSLEAQVVLPSPSATCPYPGLPAYDVGDADAFSGRDADVSACLRRLHETRVLAVVGPSGCGKSSLARAGVAAALERAGRRVVVLTPGARPLDAVNRVVSPNATLVVDQLEEALAPQVEAAERDMFFATLIARSLRSELVFTLRADRLGELAAYPAFARLLERGLYLLGTMDEANLHRAVEGPARHAGLVLEPGLTDLLVREIEGEPGALPLLSHALRQTWERREGGTLTVEGYRASGGISRAIAQTAEDLYRHYDPSERSRLRDLMLRLVIVGSEGNPTRARAPRRQVVTDTEQEQLVEQLVGARLLSSDDQGVEIAHEALVQAWPRLRSWLDEDVDGQRIMRHLAVAADTWEEMGSPESELYRGARQARAAEWRQRAKPSLTPIERAFLDAGDELAEREQRAVERQVRYQRKVNRRLLSLLAAGAVLLVAALGAGGLAVRAADKAEAEATAAEARRLGAQALLAPDIDTALLLAVEAVHLDSSSDTRANLMAALSRSPLLMGVATSSPLVDLSVNPAKDQVAVSGFGVQVYDPDALDLVGHYDDEAAAGVAFSPDGEQLLMTVNPYSPSGMTYHFQEPLRILDTTTWRPTATQLGEVPRGRTAEYALGYSSDGNRIAVGIENWDTRTVQVLVWDTREPSRPVSRINLSAWADALALSPHGETLAVMVEHGAGWLIRTYDVRTGVQTGRAGPYESTVWSDLEISPDGRSLAVQDGDTVVLLDTATLEETTRLHSHIGNVTSMGFSPDGRLLATGSADHTVTVWSTRTFDALHKLEGHSGAVFDVGFSPDSQRVYAAGPDRRLLAWDLRGGRRFVPERHIEALRPTAFVVRLSPTGNKVGYMHYFPSRLQVQDIGTGDHTPVVETRQTSENADLRWSPDGRRIATGGRDGSVSLWDPTTAHLVVRRHVTDQQVYTVSFSDDGKDILVGTDAGRLLVLDSASLRPRAPGLDVGGDMPLTALASQARGAPVLVGHAEGALHRVDLSSRRIEETLRLPWIPYSIAVSPDGRRAAVGGSNGDVGLLDSSSLEWVAPPFHAHKDSIWTVVFSGDGERFATASNGLVNLWNGRTGEFEGSMEPSTVDQMPGVAFVSGDRTVVVTTPDGTVATWDIRTSAWIAAACRMTGRNLTRVEWRDYLPDRPYRQTCAGAQPPTASDDGQR